MTILSLKQFSFSYSKDTGEVLHQIDLEANQGETIVLAGPSGSGKSTLCLVAADLLDTFPASEATGLIYRSNDLRGVRGTGVVLQNFYAQISYLRATVFEEIAFRCENSGMMRDEMIERVEDALKRLRIEYLADRNPLELSGGEKQKVVLASSIAVRPRLLILDEPLSQLDSETVEYFSGVLNDLKKDTTLLIAENNPYMTLKIADRLVVLSDGRIVANGSPAEIIGPSTEQFIDLPAWTESVNKAAQRGAIDGIKQDQKYELDYRRALNKLTRLG